ncbi:hypothetical protein D3C74_450080 [compost metagenome]
MELILVLVVGSKIELADIFIHSDNESFHFQKFRGSEMVCCKCGSKCLQYTNRLGKLQFFACIKRSDNKSPAWDVLQQIV